MGGVYNVFYLLPVGYLVIYTALCGCVDLVVVGFSCSRISFFSCSYYAKGTFFSPIFNREVSSYFIILPGVSLGLLAVALSACYPRLLASYGSSPVCTADGCSTCCAIIFLADDYFFLIYTWPFLGCLAAFIC